MPKRTIVYTPLDEVARAPRNPKAHDEQEISASLSRFGLIETIVIDERTGKLVSGHGRLDDLLAKRDLGRDLPDGVDLDTEGGWLVPVTRGWASKDDVEAAAALIALNRVGERGGWTGELTPMLVELRDVDALAGVGYSPAQIDDLVLSREAPDLDALRERVGPHDPTDSLPVVRLRLTMGTVARFTEWWATLPGEDDEEKATLHIDDWLAGSGDTEAEAEA